MLASVTQTFHALRGGTAPRNAPLGPIGVDVGANAVNLCQLYALDDGRYEIAAAASLPFDGSRPGLLGDGARLQKMLRDGVRKNGFTGRHAVVAMPAEQVKFTPLTFRTDRQLAGDAVLKALSGRLEGDLADYVVDYMPVRSGLDQEESLALAAVAHRAEVMTFLDLLANSGLVVDALDIGPAAIRRLMSVLYTSEEQGETILVLNAGAARSYISVVSGRRLLFDQPVEFGENSLIDDLAGTLDICASAARELVLHHGLDGTSSPDMPQDPENPDVSTALREILKHRFIELVDEINRILVFTAAETRGQPIGRISVLGSIGRWRGAEELLRELIEISEPDGRREIGDYFVRDGAPLADSDFFLPEMAVATGLALRGVLRHE